MNARQENWKWNPVRFLTKCAFENMIERDKRAFWARIQRKVLSWTEFETLTGKSEKEVQQINLRLWARGHTDRMNRMIGQSGRRARNG